MPSPLSRHHPGVPLPSLSRARVVGGYAKTAVETARELGADLARLGGACGLPGIEHGLPESISAASYVALLDAAAKQLGDPTFGLQVGLRMRLATFAGYGLVLCTCKTFRSAAEQTIRFEALAHDLGRSEIIEQDEVASYRWRSPYLEEPGGRHLAESVAAGICAFTTWLAGERLPLMEVAFVHPAPSDVPLEVYERTFGGTVRFGAPVTEGWFPSFVLDMPIVNADTSLASDLTPALEQRLAARQRETVEPPIVQAAREHIKTQLMQGPVRLPDVAAALGLTARTLQRKLAGAKASFMTLLDDNRRELAQHYLRDPRLTLTEVAFLLGFSEQSNFSHAFRSWFGTTPAAWRGAEGRRAALAGSPDGWSSTVALARSSEGAGRHRE